MLQILHEIYNREPRPRLRVGLLLYGDPDQYRTFPLTDDLNTFQQTLAQVVATGFGGERMASAHCPCGYATDSVVARPGCAAGYLGGRERTYRLH